MAKTISFGGMSDAELKDQEAALLRRQSYADALRSSLLSAPQQQMANGMVLPTSPAEGLSRLGQAFLLKRGEKKAEQSKSALSAEQSRRMAEALKSLAPAGVFPTAENYQGPMANPTNTPAPAVDDKTKQGWISALNAYKVDPQLGRNMIEQMAGTGPNTSPSNVQEWEYFSKLPQDQQEQYLTMRRGTPAMNLGDRFAIPSQTQPGQTRGEFDVGLRPGEQPAIRGAQQAAVEAAKTDAIPQRVMTEAASAVQAAPLQGNAVRLQGLAETSGQRAGALATKEDQFKLLDSVINDVKGQAGMMTTGFMGAATSGIPGLPAADMAANLDTLQAAAGFDKLQEMRDNSPTGGAVGSVTERELALLQATWGSLKQSQTQDQFIRNLDRFQNQVKDSWNRVEAAYQRDYGAPIGGVGAPIPAAPASGLMPNTGPTLNLPTGSTPITPQAPASGTPANSVDAILQKYLNNGYGIQ